MQLIIFSGPPGTGKSTLADVVASDLGAPVFNWDWVMAALVPFEDVWELIEGGDRDRFRDVGYSLINHLVIGQLRRGQSAIVDCVVRERALRLWSRAADEHGAELRVVECTCSDEAVHKSRIEGRTRGIPNWDELEWEWVRQARQLYVPLPGHKLSVDAVQPLDDVVAEVRAYVGVSDARDGLLEMQKVERERIATSLHDDPIQVLSVAVMRLDLLTADIDDPNVAAKAQDARVAVRTAIDRLRTMLFELHPPSLERDGLAMALDDYLGDLFSDDDVTVDLDVVLDQEPSPATRSAIFRIAREAIANIRDHARATRVRVAVRELDGGVGVVVEDNGVGFDLARTPVPPRRGLDFGASLTRSAGGRWTLASTPGAGTTVDFWMPYTP